MGDCFGFISIIYAFFVIFTILRKNRVETICNTRALANSSTEPDLSAACEKVLFINVRAVGIKLNFPPKKKHNQINRTPSSAACYINQCSANILQPSQKTQSAEAKVTANHRLRGVKFPAITTTIDKKLRETFEMRCIFNYPSPLLVEVDRQKKRCCVVSIPSPAVHTQPTLRTLIMFRRERGRAHEKCVQIGLNLIKNFFHLAPLLGVQHSRDIGH